MAYITVSPTSYEIIDNNVNEVSISYDSDLTLTDIKLSADDGYTYKDKKSMTQTSVIFDITGMSNSTYTCKLKGFYESQSVVENAITTLDGEEMITKDNFTIIFK